jgi:hypothetical protein
LTLKGKRKLLHHIYMLGWYPRTRALPNLRPVPPFGNAWTLPTKTPPTRERKPCYVMIQKGKQRFFFLNLFRGLCGRGGGRGGIVHWNEGTKIGRNGWKGLHLHCRKSLNCIERPCLKV